MHRLVRWMFRRRREAPCRLADVAAASDGLAAFPDPAEAADGAPSPSCLRRKNRDLLGYDAWEMPNGDMYFVKQSAMRVVDVPSTRNTLAQLAG